jgi:Na+/proline symporter
VVIVYTGMGGLMADAVTDIVQGTVLIFGLVMLAVAVFSSGSGAGGADLAAVPAERLDFGAAAASRWEIAELWAIPILGSVVAQEIVSRTLAARSAHTARDATLLGAVIYLSIGLIPVSLGLVGPQLLPGLAHGDQVLPALAERYLPPLLFVVFAGALVSAILSTVDSALLACSALVSHNLIGRMTPHLSERRKVVNARLTVVAFGLVAYLLARESESVYALVEMASAFGSAGIVVAATFGLFTKIGGRWSAWAALVTGAAVYLIGGEVESLHAPYLLAIACSIVAYLMAAPFGRPRHEQAHHQHAHHQHARDEQVHAAHHPLAPGAPRPAG